MERITTHHFFSKVVMILILILTCSGCPKKCEDCHRFIIVFNKTNRDIAFQDGFSTEKRWPCNPSNNQMGTMFIILADSLSSFFRGDRFNMWEYYFEDNKYLNLVFGDYESFYKYYFELHQPCDTIHKYVPILHQYLLTLEDLERMNWTVVYPPEE